jgi:hypothetical protein
MTDNIFDSIDGPNSSAYEKIELRDGIPLSYVHEKLVSNIKIIHHTYCFVRDNINDDLQLINHISIDLYSPKKDGLLSPLFASFRYSLTSLLALQNMLGIVNNQNIFDKLLAYNEEDFHGWLERIESEGSISG